MKSKQLADILIKILGLSVFINGILAFVTGLFGIWQFENISRSVPATYTLLQPLHGLVSLVIGIILIVKSKNIAGYLYKNGDE